MNINSCLTTNNLTNSDILNCSQICSREIIFDLLDNKNKYSENDFKKCSKIVENYKKIYISENKELEELIK